MKVGGWQFQSKLEHSRFYISKSCFPASPQEPHGSGSAPAAGTPVASPPVDSPPSCRRRRVVEQALCATCRRTFTMGRLPAHSTVCQARCTRDAEVRAARHGCLSSPIVHPEPAEPPAPLAGPLPPVLLPLLSLPPRDLPPPPPVPGPPEPPFDAPLTPPTWIPEVPEVLDLPTSLFEPSSVRLLLRIPLAACPAARAVGRQLCQAIVRDPAATAVGPWLLLLAFSRLVLRAPTRGGRRGRRQLAQLVRARCQRLQAGDWQDLVAEYQATHASAMASRPPPPSCSTPYRHRRSVRLARVGALGRASRPWRLSLLPLIP